MMDLGTINYTVKCLPTKGKLVYEYNTLKNLEGSEGLQGFDTESLNFSLQHPVDIISEKSYDDSVNLILNDNLNGPRIINTRFSARENNTYEIVDRVGEMDTNVYSEALFDEQTSLFKTSTALPVIDLVNVYNTGNLSVGNYTIYIKFADADDNETDIVAESGIISCFIGKDGIPSSIQGGYKEQNSNKSITIQVSNCDRAYQYIKVYFVRAYSDVDENVYTQAYKIVQGYSITSDTVTLTIYGTEEKDEISLAELNTKYFIAGSARTQAICQNRLFLGNVTEKSDDWEALQDLSLRIYAEPIDQEISDILGNLNYLPDSKGSGYYSTKNIYYYTGYWPNEFYRFGIVYIKSDGSLSAVYNILGNMEPTIPEGFKGYTIWNGEPKELQVKDNAIEGFPSLNSKGVIRFPLINKLLSLQITVTEAVSKELAKHRIRGFFFVRQKRVPVTIAQALLLPVDSNIGYPLVNGNQYESFISSTRRLVHTYQQHLRTSKQLSKKACYGICPEYDVSPAYYNQVFAASKFNIQQFSQTNPTANRLYVRAWDYEEIAGVPSTNKTEVTISAIPDNTPLTVVEGVKFRGVLGEAATAYKVQYVDYDNKETETTNIVRGILGSGLGIVGTGLNSHAVVNITTTDFQEDNINVWVNRLIEDHSPYYAITDRYSLTASGQTVQAYRGDCYICRFTHRLNRNFQDPDAAINDIIVEPKTWLDNYSIGASESAEKRAKINRGDVNAVELGSWVSFVVRSNKNLCLRALDYSYPQEEGLTGHPRGFYPFYPISAAGANKIPESSVINGGFGRTVGERYNYTLPDVPYYKNVFQTRITYSDLYIDSAFKNGYRVFSSQNYRDYSTAYGGLMKLVEIGGSLLAVFEHGLAIIPVNERTVAGGSEGGDVFINTNNVLPLNPNMLSDSIGTQWPESVIKTNHYIYGVDTVAKKIWRVGLLTPQLELISDLKVQKFLNDNITLTERELTPIIGIRNVKTHYNAFKNDVMFTFYDNLNRKEEKAWNLCFNEMQNKFITFYSWLPSYSANVDNIFFSFDRDTSKWCSYLAISKSDSKQAYGITVNNNKLTGLNYIENNNPTLSLVGIVEGKSYEYEIIKDSPFAEMWEVKGSTLTLKSNSLSQFFQHCPVEFLTIKCTVDNNYVYIGKVAFTTQDIAGRNAKDEEGNYTELLTLCTNFWKHGQSGIIDIQDQIKPCYWYGKQHPFEFEVIVADKPDTHKVFDNLRIISNKAEPESFHYEVVGQVYDFTPDKLNMYYRQEATRAMFQALGSDITYDHDAAQLVPQQQFKSTIFPLIYERQDHINKIQDSYGYTQTTDFASHDYSLDNSVLQSWISSTETPRDYVHLSGAEIVHDPQMNEFKIWNHTKAANIKKVGRLRGNMDYKEDCWEIQINSLIFAQKNEKPWSVPPIAIVGALPNDIVQTDIKDDTMQYTDFSDKYQHLTEQVSLDGWTARKEAKMRDKYIRIRVKYSGEDLAVIMALKTFYTVSYA